MELLTKWYAQTHTFCPEQYEGQLNDGRFFYLRYRFGYVSLGTSYVGTEDAVSDPRAVGFALGDGMDGVFESVEVRDEIFEKLVGMVYA